MVNRLLRRQPMASVAKVYARNITGVLQVIGGVELAPGGAAWVCWPIGRVLSKSGVLEIIEYEVSLIPSVEEQKAAGLPGPPDAPGFACPQCGLRWATQFQMTGHKGSHNPATGCPRGTVKSAKKKKALERKERNRRYNTEYQRRRRARLKAQKGA